MPVLWLEDFGADDLDDVGGKAASLGELAGADLPVPPAFVVTADTYRTFIEEAGIAEELFAAVDVDPEDSTALAEAESRAKELILGTEFPDELREEILSAYDEFDGDPFVAVRSSATAEDLPSIAADETALIRVDGTPRFGRMEELAPIDCANHTVEVPSLTDDGIQWQAVDRIYEHEARGDELIRVTTDSGRKITVSPDHSLVVLDDETLEPATATAEELDGDEQVPVVRNLPIPGDGSTEIDVTDYVRGGDVVLGDGGVKIRNESTNWSIQHGLPETLEADEQFAYFLGFYLAEGSTYGENELILTNTDEEVLERALEFPKRIGLWNDQAKNEHSYRLYCKSLVRFLHATSGEPGTERGKGRLAGNKRIPEFVFGWDADRIGAFLRGCFDGDGWVSGENAIGYTTTSERLAAGVLRLLELLGFDYRIRKKDGREWSDAYEVRIPAREAETFRERIGFESERKQKKLDDLVERQSSVETSPVFGRTISVDDALAERLQDAYRDRLSTEQATRAVCPDCENLINKSSPYDGRDRWYCPDCGSAYYESEVSFTTVERECGRNEAGQYEPGNTPWNEGRLSGRYSQPKLNRALEDLGLEEYQLDESVGWETIDSVERIEYDGPVYDFCVPGTETFAAGLGSVVTHNTASFAGQQETYLNVDSEDLLDRVRRCWASLFTQRAIYYRNEQGFAHDAVDIAVVVQEMVDAEKSGVMFTSHPSTGASQVIVEAAWGLGEAVVSGSVSPDNYVVDRATGEIEDVTVADKKTMCVRDDETGETVEREVPEKRRTARVLDDEEIDALVALGEEVEAHYDEPQDVEWAIADGEVYMLQSRPITTISEGDIAADEAGSGLGDAESTGGAAGDPGDGGRGDATREGGSATRAGGDARTGEQGVADGSGDAEAGEALVSGLGASPGMTSGPVSVVETLDQLDKVGDGDVIVTEMTTPDMVPAMKRAAGIVTDEGGMTSHAAIVSRELGVPAVVGAGNATVALADDQVVTIDGDKGTVTQGPRDTSEGREPVEEVRPDTPVKPMTATEVKVNVSIPEAAERAAATGADGVGLLRIEHLVLGLDKTPERFIADHGGHAYEDKLVDGIVRVAEEFYPRPVRVRTLDAPTDEFRTMEGGDDEPDEHNPMLGYRGIRRSLDRPDVFQHELAAFRRLYEKGYDNVEVMFPLVNDADDVRRAKDQLEEAGIDPERRTWGVMIETPASALGVAEMADCGIDFASFGTNDLTQYTLAVDRNNGNVADRFDELHPAVLELISTVIETCREHDVDTSICGQAGSKPEMVRFLVEEGISSISANIDAVRDVQHEVKRVEQKLLLDSVR